MLLTYRFETRLAIDILKQPMREVYGKIIYLLEVSLHSINIDFEGSGAASEHSQH